MRTTPERLLARRLFWTLTGLALAGGAVAWSLGGATWALGLLGGMVTGAVAVAGIFLVVALTLRPPGEVRPRARRTAVLVQVVKLLLVLGLLYTLVAQLQVNAWALLVGLSLPVAAMAVLALFLPRSGLRPGAAGPPERD